MCIIYDITKYYKDRDVDLAPKLKFSGRGIDLVEQLCYSLDYQENGTVVEASYVWTS